MSAEHESIDPRDGFVLLCVRCAQRYRSITSESEWLHRCMCGGALDRDYKREIAELVDNPRFTLSEIEPRLRVLLASLSLKKMQ